MHELYEVIDNIGVVLSLLHLNGGDEQLREKEFIIDLLKTSKNKIDMAVKSINNWGDND